VGVYKNVYFYGMTNSQAIFAIALGLGSP